MAPPTAEAAEACEYDRRRPLFDRTLPVEVVGGGGGSGGKEEQALTIRVLKGQRARGERVLRLEVTTDASVGAMAAFLHSLDVGEADFPELKRDQSLLVDFGAFPAKLVELLQGCCCCCPFDSPGDDGAQQAPQPQPQFRARLDTASGALSIVEATPFKELTHLALRVRPAHDGALKAYLAGRLRHTLSLAEERRQELADAEQRLSRSEERARALEAEAAQKAAAQEEELARVKAGLEAELAAARGRYEGEVRSLREQRDKAVGSLQRRLGETERRRVELQEGKRAQEGEIRELTRRVESLQAGVDGLEGENAGLRDGGARLEAEVAALQRERAELQRVEGGLRQQVADREEALAQARALQAAAQQGQARAEEALALYKGNALQLQERLEGSVGEIQRGNQIIQKLQGEGAELKRKVRSKGEVLKQQERLLQERQRALDEAQHRLEAATRDGARAEGELAAATAKLEEAGRLNESNQQVITWLNKEINDLQLGRGSGLLPAYHGGGKQGGNLSMASGSTAATYTPAYARYASSAGIHDTTASTISAASSAYLLSPITPVSASAPTGGPKAKKGSGKKAAAATTTTTTAGAGAAAATAAGASSTGKKAAGEGSSSSSNTGVSTIYLDALGLADSTGSLSPLTPAAGTAH